MDTQTETEFRRIAGLVQAGKLALAQQAAKAALAQHPRAFFPHNILGIVQSAAGQWNAAKKHFLKALKHDSDNRDGLRNLGTAQYRLGELQSAQQTLSKLVRLHPEYAEGWFSLGNVHLARQAEDKAEACFQKALRLKPDHEMAANNIMWLQDTSGRLEALEETVSALEKALPDSAIGGLYRGILQLRHKDFAAAKATLEPFAFNPAVSMDMARLEGLRLDHLARAEDALGNFEAAFELFTASNTLNQTRLKHPAVSAIRHMDGLHSARRYFSPGFSQNWSQSAMSEAAPVFMVGFARAGAGVAQALLRDHSGIEIFDELPNVQRLRQDIGSFNAHDLDGLNTLTLGAMDAAANTYLRAVKSDRLAIDKLPLNLAYAGEILRVFPKARFILIERDPAETVLSAFKQPFRLNDATATMDTLENTATTFDLEYGLWKQVIEELSPAIITLRYEDMLADSAAAIAPVLAFLGLAPEATEGSKMPNPAAALTGVDGYAAHMKAAREILEPWRVGQGY